MNSLPPVLCHMLSAIDSEHEGCPDDHREHDRHAVSLPEVTRWDVGDHCPDKEYREPNGGGNPNRGHANTNRQSQCTRCFDPANVDSMPNDFCVSSLITMSGNVTAPATRTRVQTDISWHPISVSKFRSDWLVGRFRSAHVARPGAPREIRGARNRGKGAIAFSRQLAGEMQPMLVNGEVRLDPLDAYSGCFASRFRMRKLLQSM
jgi:hypothetical protein